VDASCGVTHAPCGPAAQGLMQLIIHSQWRMTQLVRHLCTEMVIPVSLTASALVTPTISFRLLTRTSARPFVHGLLTFTGSTVKWTCLSFSSSLAQS
jgi:hypothetical protein